MHVDGLALDQELKVRHGRVVEGRAEGLHQTLTLGHLGQDRLVRDGGRGVAGEDVVQGLERRARGVLDGLTSALTPHVDLVVLGEGRGDVAVVEGGDVDHPPDLDGRSGRGTAVGLVTGSQLAVGVGAPRVEGALVGQDKRVGVTADNLQRTMLIATQYIISVAKMDDLRHDSALESGDPAGVELVDVVPDPELAVAIVAPAEYFPRLEDGHGRALTAGDRDDPLSVER